MLRISELQIIRKRQRKVMIRLIIHGPDTKVLMGKTVLMARMEQTEKMEKQVIHTLPMRILRMEKQISLCRTVIVSISVCMRILPSKIVLIQMITRGHL